MKKYVPYSKMSKKKKREEDRSHRTTWGPLNPTTRVVRDKTKYDRRREKAKYRRGGSEE
ncbi:MAG: hypothetical protein IKT15_03185 [Firmicutes bacterium]|nr:hypothetical protein [Bacillota bacterium]